MSARRKAGPGCCVEGAVDVNAIPFEQPATRGSAQLVVCWNAGSHEMSGRSIRSWRWRLSERRAFQQTEVGLRDGDRAMGKALTQILDEEQDPARARGCAGRFVAEGELKMSSWKLFQTRHSVGGRAEGRRLPCGQAARQRLGGCEQGHDVSGGRALAELSSSERLSIDRPPQA
jgi:hypothetical protein